MNKNEGKWAWHVEDVYAHGPFDTKEAAQADADFENEDATKVWVGKIHYPDPAEYFPGSEEILELMNEKALDGEFGFMEEDVFYVHVIDEKPFNKALDELVRKYVSTTNPNRWAVVDAEPYLTSNPEETDEVDEVPNDSGSEEDPECSQ